MSAALFASQLTPAPRECNVTEGQWELRGRTVAMRLPPGPAYEAAATVLRAALVGVGATVEVGPAPTAPHTFVLGDGADLPGLPAAGDRSPEAYALAVSPRGAAAVAASPAALLHAAQTLRQLTRLAAADGRLPGLVIRDWPEFRWRGLYIEGGQERYGRIVAKDYLLEQIRRLAEFKLNLLVIECYNLFPYSSFPACADAGSLTPDECREVVAEARRYHVTLMPSLQTLAQASELVWANEAGAPYREVTAPGLICPSNPDVYPFIKGLYRDLLAWFPDTPLLGVGCSEIDMQWQSRYCPRCQARIAKGETVRDLLLGHAETCIRAVEELARELGRPVRPLIWGDEFYMYGPGRDWVGLERIPKNVVMGYWKYWPDYAGISGLMERGYDVLGISALYNHCFYLADLSPEDPPKVWAPMAQTGVANIAGMAASAVAAGRAHPGREFLGIATASFSKHRLRAFDSLWYGFVLNGHWNWNPPPGPGLTAAGQGAFTRAFVRHYYDARTDAAAEGLATAWEGLDRAKSRLELANQTLHDVVGVYDTQEPGYQGNTLLGAWQCAHDRLGPDGKPDPALADIRAAARQVAAEAAAMDARLDLPPAAVARQAELADLRLAAAKIRSHAERQALLIDTQEELAAAPALPLAEAQRRLAPLAARWQAHRDTVADLRQRLAPLCSQGDPCGFGSLLGDVAAIAAHVSRLATVGPDTAPAATAGEVVLDEPLASLDPARWEVLGQPQLADRHLDTRAPGGWERYCGLLTRQTFALDADRALMIEFELTPVQMGVDSQLLASSVQPNSISYRFAFCGVRTRFGVHTQSTAPLDSRWVDPAPGWRARALSPEVKPDQTYRVRAELTRTTWRVVVARPDQGPWEMPFWDTGPVPMDDLAETRILFGDVEPEGGTAASRWGPIRMWLARRP